MRKLLFALSALVLVATSCKKDKDDEPVTPTKENLTGSYKVTKMEGISSGSTTDLFNNPNWTEPCEKDDIHKLNADNSYQWVDAGTKCDPPGDYEDTWSLTNSTTIVIDGYSATIKSFNGRTLVLSENFMGTEIVTTYAKQ